LWRWDQELNRQVALKEIQERYAGDPNSLGRFVREAEIDRVARYIVGDIDKNLVGVGTNIGGRRGHDRSC
jgi:hypothetical protein